MGLNLILREEKRLGYVRKAVETINYAIGYTTSPN
jgi:hypothetical protein